jgi:hypothetical protein
MSFGMMLQSFSEVASTQSLDVLITYDSLCFNEFGVSRSTTVNTRKIFILLRG